MAALQQPQQGQNLAYLAAGNWLRGLGIEGQPEINRILVRACLGGCVTLLYHRCFIIMGGSPGAHPCAWMVARASCPAVSSVAAGGLAAGRNFACSQPSAHVPRLLQDIAMNPNSVFTSRDRKQPSNPHARKLDVEADLQPLLAFLQGEAGMTQEQVAKVR